MPHDRSQDLSELDDWVAAIAPEVGVDPDDVPVGEILDLAKAVAHGVLRPGVPVTAFVAGLAAGRGLSAQTVLVELTRRADAWRAAPSVEVTG
ncbi:DUF6457 domain-containing protein [Granulicoccus sp. GXG6511]|uniref:DUF6457 domain-containing protein n=1 Tax=Granulicoccus sp. GXG6511 TaxID=3381351 RepID=UPI003D7D086B